MLYISQMDARAVELARERGLGLELIEFCSPERQEDEAALARWSGELRRFEAASLHAPYAELFPCAVDREVRAVARRRLLRAGEICARLGVRRMIAHSGCAPRLYFPEWYVPQSVEFWRELLRELPEGVELLLENVLDPEPSELAAIVDGVGDPRLGVCLDIGHANVYSPRPVSEWISTLGARIRHVHLHNNGGDRDAHAPLGEGSMDVPPLLAMLRECAPEADWCIESRDAEACLRELEGLGFGEGNSRERRVDGKHRAPSAQERSATGRAEAMARGERCLEDSIPSCPGKVWPDAKGEVVYSAENAIPPRRLAAELPSEGLPDIRPEKGSPALPFAEGAPAKLGGDSPCALCVEGAAVKRSDKGAAAVLSGDALLDTRRGENSPYISSGDSLPAARLSGGSSSMLFGEGVPVALNGDVPSATHPSESLNAIPSGDGFPVGQIAGGATAILSSEDASPEASNGERKLCREVSQGRDVRYPEREARADVFAMPAAPFDPHTIQIPAPDAAAMAAAEARQRMLAKPPGSLGVLEEISIRFAGMTGRERNRARRRRLLVFAADNGVTAEGVSSAPKSVTLAQTVNLARGMTGAATLARHFDTELRVYDVGVDAPGPLGGGVAHRRIANGTRNLAVEPAMTREQVLASLRVGFDAAVEAADAGVEIIGIGEMGIGNTTTSAAVLSALLNLPADVTVGRGGGVNDAGFARKLEIVDAAVARLNGAKDVVDVLAEVGGLDIAAMCGAFIGAASRRLPAVIDGYISVVAALCAERLAPGCRNYMFASHASWERGYARAVEALELKPMLALEMRLGEGSGCPLAFAVIDAALMVHDEMATFEQARIDDAYLAEIRGDARLQR